MNLVVQYNETEVASATSDLVAALPLVCNVSNDVLGANIRSAMDRNLPIVDFCTAHDQVALLVGGGPSLEHELQDISERQQNGAIVFAMNGSGHWLVARGVIPDALILLDARDFNTKFIAGLPRSVTLYLATQCAPAVFDAAMSYEVISWHSPTGGLSGVREQRSAAFICGGTSVGMRAMHLAAVLGFRTLHLYGYDSSYDGDRQHAYEQIENSGDRPVECWIGERHFLSTPWMIRQADDFKDISVKFMNLGVSYHVHGDGLLPYLARQMALDPEESLTGDPAVREDA